MKTKYDKEYDSQQLRDGILELGLIFDQDKINLLLQYVKLLLKWNKTYSLTAITSFEQITTLHLLDGLTVIPHLGNAKSIIDVGSGMGVPGVIIAIWCPDVRVYALDSNHKKTAFLQQVAIELGLSNFKVICSKVEGYTPDSLYDVAISRAFTSSRMFIDLTANLLDKHGSWLLMKSQKVQSELDNVIQYRHSLTQLNLPGCLDKRYLLKIENYG